MQDVEDPKNKHRHVSHLFAVHPGRQITPVTGLRTRGGFQIDLAWRDRKLTTASISSKNGGMARLRANGKIETVSIPPGGKHSISL